MWSYFANPERFDRLARALLPWCWGVAAALFAIGLPWALYFSPGDYQQSDTVRIMYVHVPAAWLAMGLLAAALAGCRHLPRSTVTALTGIGHMAPILTPEPVAEAILAVLS